MAPLLGNSWSSFWASLTGYAPLQNGETGGSNTAASSHTAPDTLRPTLGQILMSKRVRYTASAVVAGALFFFAFRNYDRLPTLDSLRQTTAGGATTPYCPTPEIPATVDGSVDWSRFAYTQYVTNIAYLCNSVMIFETLHRLGSRADRVMMYPEDMMDPAETKPESEEAKLLVKSRDQYKVKLVPVAVQRRSGGDGKFFPSKIFLQP